MSTENVESAGQGKAEALSSSALARRRILLKGVSRGTSVLAATVPIQTLAGQSLLTFDGLHQCSVSGMQSGVHSATPSSTAVCGGYSISYWSAGSGNGNSSPTNPWPPNVNYQAVWSTVFLPKSGTDVPTGLSLIEVLRQYPGSDEAHWISAWLNAQNGSFNFPYTAQQVLDYYYSPLLTTYQNALDFFTTYMETPVL